MRIRVVFLLVISSMPALAQAPGWWMREPIRWVLPVNDIRVRLDGEYREAKAAVPGRKLSLQPRGDTVELVLPRLDQYEVIVLRESR